MRGVGSLLWQHYSESVLISSIMAGSVAIFSLSNATSISHCSEDMVEESCVVHQADVSSEI